MMTKSSTLSVQMLVRMAARRRIAIFPSKRRRETGAAGAGGPTIFLRRILRPDGGRRRIWGNNTWGRSESKREGFLTQRDIERRPAVKMRGVGLFAGISFADESRVQAPHGI